MGKHKQKKPWNRKADTGERAWKRVTMRVIPPEGHLDLVGTIVAKAQPGRCYTEENIEEIIEKMVERLDARFPHWDFEMVRLGVDRINFVYKGLREAANGVESVPTGDIQSDQRE